MGERLYSDLCVRALRPVDEDLADCIEVQFFDTGKYDRPLLVLPNLLAVKRVRDYLHLLMLENKSYFKNNGGTSLPKLQKKEEK